MTNGHGDDRYNYNRPIISNFSSNVFYAADTSGLKEHLCQRMDVIDNYPEPEPYTLAKELVRYHHLPDDECICVTNGATEAIYLIAQSYTGATSLILSPTFSEYADACRMYRHQVIPVYSLEEISEKVSEDIEMVWICNPNNPTGKVQDKAFLTKLIRENEFTCFVIDQAYGDFTQKEIFTPAEAFELGNVLLLQSMTKKYAIPGLRLGYIMGAKGLLPEIIYQRMPWSVNQLAIEAGLYILRNDIPQKVRMAEYLSECDWLREMLESTGAVEVWPTDTHFMLARLRIGTAKALKDYLANEHGLLIRDASNFEGLGEEFFRVAGRSREENIHLVRCIGEWLSLQKDR